MYSILLATNARRPEKVDFVRMAGLMDAIIVPFAAIGKRVRSHVCMYVCMYVLHFTIWIFLSNLKSHLNLPILSHLQELQTRSKSSSIVRTIFFVFFVVGVYVCMYHVFFIHFNFCDSLYVSTSGWRVEVAVRGFECEADQQSHPPG